MVVWIFTQGTNELYVSEENGICIGESNINTVTIWVFFFL